MREWQESGTTAGRCYWVTEQACWAGLIPSAVRFLSDGVLGKFCDFLTALEVDSERRKYP